MPEDSEGYVTSGARHFSRDNCSDRTNVFGWAYRILFTWTTTRLHLAIYVVQFFHSPVSGLIVVDGKISVTEESKDIFEVQNTASWACELEDHSKDSIARSCWGGSMFDKYVGNSQRLCFQQLSSHLSEGIGVAEEGFSSEKAVILRFFQHFLDPL